jgi:hypothetical protein
LAVPFSPMSLPIHVTAYSGYKANERPRDFTVDEDLYEIAEVEDRWYEPEAMYFRVRTAEGRRYILRYDESGDEWTLQSGFDGDELLARPSIRLVTVDADLIRQAEKEIESCEHCHSAGASRVVGAVLDGQCGNGSGSIRAALTEPPII